MFEVAYSFEITYAKPSQAEEIVKVTKDAFLIYQDALHTQQTVKLSALTETADDVIKDIENHTVLVAKENGKVIGAIRVEALSQDLAYIYRFAVDPSESSGGVGSELLAAALKDCVNKGYSAVCLHTNAKYYKLARYYYGKEFYVHSTNMSKGYIRALFVKDLKESETDLSPADKK